MENVVNELRSVVEAYSQKFYQISDSDFSAKLNPVKWSKKEVIGHLVDSAQNNLRRFIVGQYDHQPNIIYQQDFWVQANNYQHAKKDDVIELWRLINNQIAAILTSMPKENYTKICNTGKETPELHTIEWLASDYVRHLKHHINQVIPKSFDIAYP
jgi:hypothetical protein